MKPMDRAHSIDLAALVFVNHRLYGQPPLHGYNRAKGNEPDTNKAPAMNDFTVVTSTMDYRDDQTMILVRHDFNGQTVRSSRQGTKQSSAIGNISFNLAGNGNRSWVSVLSSCSGRPIGNGLKGGGDKTGLGLDRRKGKSG